MNGRDTGAMRPVLELSRCIAAEPQHAVEMVDAFLQDNSFPLLDADTAVFFFRGDATVEAVYLVHWVFGLESRQHLLRLEGTHAWYLPVELPGRARVEYKFEVVSGGQSRWVRDPLNDQLARDPFGSNSVAAMPGYHAPRWVSPEEGARPGRVTAFQLPTEVYGGEREIQVYLPSEYKPHKRYPLLICHDGKDYLRFAAIKTVLDNLIARHEVAPLVVAFTSGVDRNREYGADPRQAAFLVRELLPAMQERYGVGLRPEDRGLLGASFGAVTSLYTAWKNPGVFGRLMLQSGSFVFTDIGHHGRSELFDPVVDFVNGLRADPGELGARIFLSCGTFESLIWFNRSLKPLLQDRGLEVRFVEAQDGHNWIAWRDRLRDGLTWLFPGRLWMYYE